MTDYLNSTMSTQLRCEYTLRPAGSNVQILTASLQMLQPEEWRYCPVTGEAAPAEGGGTALLQVEQPPGRRRYCPFTGEAAPAEGAGTAMLQVKQPPLKAPVLPCYK
ncbi:hypothetical protein NDU88_000275 [Pleurodeles waltl]|uniref:Uncharacterized protein n=1 Tax=Pleurodeles waltl TaxID=8319 RepID=A0AAV7KV70_PLEWA|nr:hypothetical protein NDU88_000275 [Pleurodeles waltl]